MVLAYVQKTIAEIIGVEKPKEIGLEFSFVEDKRMNEDEFFSMLEDLEEEMQIDLVDYAWKFETVKQLVDYINRHK
ncbi:hypothetical protein [Vallitalea maricola]|uniref:Uncharacterized protein n=1 Tax=Vallitalea maricola TaxID=3074433 RepID=A0ACB5UGY9_9FIRM|nr:hypothetical protein AN2V17_13630 [Vallitalea sp. AN17-2]